MKKVASTVNQEAGAPATSSSEYTLWLEYLNRGVQEWSEANDWEAAKKTYFPTITGTSQATVALPLDFEKLSGPIVLHGTSEDSRTEYPDVIDEQRGQFTSTDQYIIIRGDISSGKNVIFHPANLTSGASLEIPYFSMPTSLASPGQVPVVPDSQFLIDRTVAYIFEARSDARFQLVEQKARERLMMMIENENLAKYNSYNNPNYVQNAPLKRHGFRVGRD